MAESYLMPMPTAIPIDEALLWTKIGAIGTLVGSAFSFIAIIISIVAFLSKKDKNRCINCNFFYAQSGAWG